ncbi:hypothetical protein ACLOJK_027147, partial [Asimina triloba]
TRVKVHRRSTRLGAPSPSSRPAAMAAGDGSSGEHLVARSDPGKSMVRTVRPNPFKIERWQRDERPHLPHFGSAAMAAEPITTPAAPSWQMPSGIAHDAPHLLHASLPATPLSTRRRADPHLRQRLRPNLRPNSSISHHPSQIQPCQQATPSRPSRGPLTLPPSRRSKTPPFLPPEPAATVQQPPFSFTIHPAASLHTQLPSDHGQTAHSISRPQQPLQTLNSARASNGWATQIQSRSSHAIQQGANPIV